MISRDVNPAPSPANFFVYEKAGSGATGAWENEGGAVSAPARESAERPAAKPSCFAMILCPDCLRTKPHWVAWHTGSCRVLCQDCGRLSEMDDGTQIHEAVSSKM